LVSDDQNGGVLGYPLSTSQPAAAAKSAASRRGIESAPVKTSFSPNRRPSGLPGLETGDVESGLIGFAVRSSHCSTVKRFPPLLVAGSRQRLSHLLWRCDAGTGYSGVLPHWLSRNPFVRRLAKRAARRERYQAKCSCAEEAHFAHTPEIGLHDQMGVARDHVTLQPGASSS